MVKSFVLSAAQGTWSRHTADAARARRRRDRMKRRTFISLLGGTVAAWPLAARAQQPDRVRRIGLLMAWAESDPEAQPRMAAFMSRLRELGWIDGRNCRIERHWSAGDIERMDRQSKELVASAPDVILAMTNPMVEAVHKLTRTIPIVFLQISTPVESGWVASMARPGGNRGRSWYPPKHP
jgi:putative tryptophan/tyrosine transport system substrate-binding protein